MLRSTEVGRTHASSFFLHACMLLCSHAGHYARENVACSAHKQSDPRNLDQRNFDARTQADCFSCVHRCYWRMHAGALLPPLGGWSKCQQVSQRCRIPSCSGVPGVHCCCFGAVWGVLVWNQHLPGNFVFISLLLQLEAV